LIGPRCVSGFSQLSKGLDYHSHGSREANNRSFASQSLLEAGDPLPAGLEAARDDCIGDRHHE